MIAEALAAESRRIRTFANGASLLAAARVRTPACIVVDLHMPDRSGLDVLRELNAVDYGAPIILTSGHGDIPTAVAAIKEGAYDFVVKPFDSVTIKARVDVAIAAWKRDQAAVDAHAVSSMFFPGHELLTPREREIVAEITAGASSKEAGRRLGISYRTVEVHRCHIMAKLGAKNSADLVRIVMTGSPEATADI
jgi:FixJ family two-component response regulator